MLKSLQGRLTLLFVAFVLLVVISVSTMFWGSKPARGAGRDENAVDKTLNYPTLY